MRVLAIDYGDARTGIAISDASGSIVGRTTVIHSRRPQQTAEAIAALVQESGAERLVMGFPRNMDGTEGPRAVPRDGRHDPGCLRHGGRALGRTADDR